ncbi:hypothetical protein [Coleofasciculus sp.]|uniref:hypothetical protein n=1 Tax=Coleofasciculus sp. TaxID=3100458 RepID=UPI003A2A4500
MPDSVNYQQPDYVEKRVRYFDGQYLKVQDFVNEQQYHIDRLRRHHRFLVVSGIVDGLTVTAKANSAGVTISAGTAIDKEGRQILLNKSYLFNREEFPKAGETTSNTPGVELDLQSYKDKGDCNLFIVYDERETDQQSEGGSQNDTRFHERPNFEVIPVNQPQSDQGILLAKLKITADKVEVNSSVRQYSGLRLPGAETSEVTLRYQGDKNSKLAVLQGNLKVTGNLTVFDGKVGIGTTDPQAKLDVNGNTRLGGTLTVMAKTDDGSPKLKIANPDSDSDFVDFTFYGKGMGQLMVDGWSKGWNISNTTNDKHLYLNRNAKENSDVYIGRNGHELVVKGKNGNIGIGTTQPNAKLDISGSANTAGQISLQLKSGNGSNNYNSNQITLGYNNTAEYRHAIKTRHHSGQRAGNAIDFYIWQQGKDTKEDIGTLHTLTLDGGNVGIGTTNPQAKLEVNGNTRLNGTLTVTGNTDIGGNIQIKGSQIKSKDGYGIVETNQTDWLRINPDSKYPGIALFQPVAIGTGGLAVGEWTQQSQGVLKVTQSAYLATTGGNVGIGTTAPKAKLDVRGDIALGFKETGGYKLLLTNQQKTHYIQANDWWTEFVSHPNQGWKFISIRENGTIEKECLRITSSGRILINGKDFSQSGTSGNGGLIRVPWGTTQDWNIFVSPRIMGREEPGSEGDNALLVIECYAEILNVNMWKITVRSKYRESDRTIRWESSLANYILILK